MATDIQFLRSSDPQLRPDPSTIEDGMPMLNYDSSEPGLYFRLDDRSLIKVGPCTVSTVPPNTNAQGYIGNCIGETWLDISDSGSPSLKIWDGVRWVETARQTDVYDALSAIKVAAENPIVNLTDFKNAIAAALAAF